MRGQHVDVLRRLLPPVSYDPNAPLLNEELVAEGKALDAAAWSSDQILAEADPHTCVLTLPDWERNYGLPEQFMVEAGLTNQTIAERRAALCAKVYLLGGQSRSFFIGLAARLGYAITISELRHHDTECDTEYPVRDEQYDFIWQVNAPAVTVRESTTEDDTEMPTEVWGNALLDAVIRHYKPSHTVVLFSYD